MLEEHIARELKAWLIYVGLSVSGPPGPGYNVPSFPRLRGPDYKYSNLY